MALLPSEDYLWHEEGEEVPAGMTTTSSSTSFDSTSDTSGEGGEPINDKRAILIKVSKQCDKK